MNQRLSGEQKIAIVAHYAIDPCVTRVAVAVGSSAMTVWRFLKKQGIDTVATGTRRKGIGKQTPEPKVKGVALHLKSLGKRHQDSAGYIRVNVGPSIRRREHTIVVETALGRPLKRGEVVHHIDEDRENNAPTNLLVCTTGYHLKLHARMRKVWGDHNPFRKDVA